MCCGRSLQGLCYKMSTAGVESLGGQCLAVSSVLAVDNVKCLRLCDKSTSTYDVRRMFGQQSLLSSEPSSIVHKSTQ